MRVLDGIFRQLKFKYLLFACVIVVLLGYTLSAYLCSSMIIEYNGGLLWRSSPQGSLFPIPHGPGMLTALSPVSSLDAFIYHYLLRVPSLIVVDVLVIAILWFKFITRL